MARLCIALAVGWLAGCGPRAASSSSSPSVSKRVEAPRCVIRDPDVGFTSLALVSDAPAAGAMVIYPYALLRHADTVELELSPGPHARVVAETSTLRLRGLAQVSDLVFHPATPSTFGELVIPLATSTLQWRDTAGDRVLLLPGRQAGTYINVKPEWRDCSYLRLREPPRFDLGLPRTTKLLLAAGGYLVRTSPDAPGSQVTLYLRGGEDIWLLGTQKSWARILWEADDVAIVGWIDRTDGPGPAMGHGSGTGTGVHIKACVPGPAHCDDDVALFSEREGHTVEIGAIKRGVGLTLGPANGEYTPVTLCDPDVELVEATVVRTADAARCR